MGSIGQPQTGQLASTPKVCKVLGDDRATLVYRNLGNNHSMPYIWGSALTVASGTTTLVVASGIKFHGYDLATYGNFVATPEGDLGYCYITKDTDTNVVTLNVSSSAANENIVVNVQAMLGVSPDLDALNCRGNTGAQQSLP